MTTEQKSTRKFRAILPADVKFYSILKIILLIIICFVLLACGTTMSSIEKEDNIEFKVNDSNASYFDVKERMKFIKRHNMSSWSKVEWYGYDCSKLIIPKPVGYLSMPAFYDNRAGWRKANAPLERFEHHVTHMAELYVIRADNSYAKCLAKTLSEWAEKGSLLSFDYHGNSKQAWYAIAWTASSAAMAYSIVKDNPLIELEIKDNIENWLRKVVKNKSATLEDRKAAVIISPIGEVWKQQLQV